MEKKLHTATQKKANCHPIPSNHSNPFLIPGARYSNEKMREIIVIVIMVHEEPFSIVEDEVWMWAPHMLNQNFRRFLVK